MVSLLYLYYRSISGHDDESIQGAAISPDSLLLVTGDVTGVKISFIHTIQKYFLQFI